MMFCLYLSKRGWTTWTTAAVDKRVFAALPIVMVKFVVFEILELENFTQTHFY